LGVIALIPMGIGVILVSFMMVLLIVALTGFSVQMEMSEMIGMYMIVGIGILAMIIVIAAFILTVSILLFLFLLMVILQLLSR
jgi:hypothetical protein